MWVRQRLPRRQHRPGRHPYALQNLHHLIRRALPCPLRNDGIQRILPLQPSPDGRIPCVRRQLRRLDGPAERPPVGVVAHRDCHPLVLASAGVAAVGRHRRVPVAHAPRPLAVEGVGQQPLADKRRAVLVHRQVNPRPAPGLGPVKQRRHHRHQRRPRRQEIRVRVSYLVGHPLVPQLPRPVVFHVSHERPGAVSRFQRRRHRAEVAPWPRMSVPRVGHHDQVRLHCPQRCVVQPEPRHHSRREVLQHNVAHRHQFLHDALRLFRPQVQRQAALAPVQRLERSSLLPPKLAGLIVRERPGDCSRGLHELGLAGVYLDDLRA